jgi:outer membrane protein TolC
MMFTACICRADVLDYRTVILDSIGHSASVRVKSEDVCISNAQYRNNFAGLYPEIKLGGRAERYENIDHRDNTDVNSIGNEIIGGNQSAWKSSLSVSAQYYLSHWYKKIFEAGYYEKLRDTSIHECESELKKTVRDVTDLFRKIVEAKTRLIYAGEILTRLNEILKLKTKASAEGQFSYEDILKAQADVFNTQKDIAGIRKDIRENFVSLSNYTGKSYSDDMEIATLSYNHLPDVVDETGIIAQTPEYKARQMELEAFRSKKKSVSANFLPDILIYGRYDLFNSSPNSLDDSLKDVRPTDYSVGLYVNLPLFDGGARKWDREKTLHELKKAEENARLVFNEKNREIKTLQIGYAELSKSYAHYKKLGEQYEKIIDINRKSQILGERSNLDILELEKDALTVERDLKIVEHALAVYEKQVSLELNFNAFTGEYGGNGTCKY